MIATCRRPPGNRKDDDNLRSCSNLASGTCRNLGCSAFKCSSEEYRRKAPQAWRRFQNSRVKGFPLRMVGGFVSFPAADVM
jgi:hypothetical protein